MADTPRIGRPTLYTAELGLEICTRIASGEMLIDICSEEGMPHEVTVRRWVLKSATDPHYAGFRSMYAEARIMQIEHEVDEIKKISDTPEIGVETFTKANGDTETREGDMLGHRRFKADTRKWRISKIAWHTYGDRVQVESPPDSEGLKVTIVGGLPSEG